jgi:hypothetical protein
MEFGKGMNRILGIQHRSCECGCNRPLGLYLELDIFYNSFKKDPTEA